MKTTATLIKTELLPSNFKLTFSNERGELYLILHQNKREIYDNLKIGTNYSFSGKKGRKNYYFINPQSIKKTNFLNISNSFQRETKNIFLVNLKKDLQIPYLNEQEVNKKLTHLKKLQKEEDKQLTIIWMKDYIKTLFLKYHELEHNWQNENFSKQEKEFLEEIKFIFNFDLMN